MLREARSATVSIKTPNGTGSGFFIAEGNIITNRHVLEIAQETVDKLRHNIETGRQLIELEKKKIWDLRERLRKIPAGPTREQLKIVIEERQRNLEQILPKQEEAEQRLGLMDSKIRASDVEIILEGGETYRANDMMLSEDHDLALIYLYIPNQHYLTPPPSSKQIRQGDKVYTIGSPSGLRNTVTAGIFSGFRKRTTDDQVFLQTDAPINPGNSGGPLIDEEGYVLGVNTSILKDTEGIGFAIPINTVFEEFNLSSY
jgi:S1-C subfamily serine protease